MGISTMSISMIRNILVTTRIFYDDLFRSYGGEKSS